MAIGKTRENIKVALRSIRAQMLRTILTSLIIAIGIMALVGILTAIDAIKVSLTGNFALLGANTFTIQNRGPNIRIGSGGEKPRNYPKITYYEALRFKDRLDDPRALPSVSFQASGIAEVKYQNRVTNPNISVMAVDENYLQTGGYKMEVGRNFSSSEVEEARPVALIGPELKEKLFADEEALGALVRLAGQRYRVVGVLKSKGNSFGFGGDKSIWIPITQARKTYPVSNRSFAINVMASSGDHLESAISQSTALMRAVRKLKPKEEDNFVIVKSDSLSQTLIENLSKVTAAAVLIAAITLLGAAIALMNIMLVSVTERTREIGVRKAIGAKASTIRNQFLTEAIVICFLGGAGGIVLGIAIGNGTSALIGGQFIIPWLWMLVSALLCLIVGLVSGFYPAYKASKLDPIEALRYE